MALTVILDSEALSVLADPTERGATAKRAQAVLVAARVEGAQIRVPAVVVIEASTTRTRRENVRRLINSHRGVGVLNLDSDIALIASELLERTHLGNEHLVDATVAATAIKVSPGSIIATADPKDLRTLVGDERGIEIQPL
jgi:hypothetical protein